jgi:hypothetical protein
MTIMNRGLLAALSALSAAAVLFAAALVQALTLAPAAAPPVAVAGQRPDAPVADTLAARPRVPSETTLQPGDIALAVDHDPFQPDRRRPEPFRLPGEDVPSVPMALEAPPPPDFRVVGTVVAGDAGLAVIEVADSAPRVMGVGESLLGYRLESVGATSATMVGRDRTLQLALGASAPRAASSRSGRGAAALSLNPQLLRTLQQRFGDDFTTVLERLQQSGPAGQAQIQSLIERAMGQNVQRGGGPGMRVRRDTLDVPRHAPDDR